MRWNRVALIGLLIGSCAAAVFLCWQLLSVLRFALLGSIDSDVTLFFTLGRGILNGFTPYVDLYESKPPGIFLLAAFSLVTSGDERMYLLIQAAMIAALPVLLAYAGWRMAPAGAPRLKRALVSVIAGVLGLLIALYLEQRSGAGQAEAFGAFFACVYVTTLALHPESKGWRITLLRVVSLLGALGIKEPFILSILASAVLMLRTRRAWLRAVVLPLGIAATSGITLLLLLAWLLPYLTIHLPAMLGSRVAGETIDPTMLHMLSVRRPYADMVTYYSAPAFGFLITGLFLSMPALRLTKHDGKTWAVGVAGAAAVIALLFFGELPATILYFRVMHPELVLEVPRLLSRMLLLALPLAGVAVLVYGARRSAVAREALLLLPVLLLVSLAVGIAGYVGNHFAFSIPVLFAVALIALRSMSASDAAPAWILAVSVILTAFLYSSDPRHTEYLKLRTTLSAAHNAVFVQKFDSLLDACGFERYYAIGAYQSLAFAKHSTTGPLPVLDFHKYLPPDHPLIIKTVNTIRDHADVFLLHEETKNPDIEGFLKREFTTEAPSCAAQYLPIEGYRVYFNKRAAS